MPLPLIILIGAGVASAGGLGAGIHGAVKMGNAKERMEEIDALHHRNIEKFRIQNVETCGIMDRLGMLQLNVLKSFGDFSKIFEKLRSKPEFKHKFESGSALPDFSFEEIQNVSVGAVALLNALKGGVAGAAGGFAAAGAVSAAVTALGTSSTGTVIASLSGKAAINATLAALGGGSLAAGGGGVALGSLVLNTATLGVGLLIGGILFSISSYSLSKKAEEAWEQVKIEEASVAKICEYLKTLQLSGVKYYDALDKVRVIYNRQYRELSHTVNVLGRTTDFSHKETINIQNTILLVQLLHEMCKVNLVVINENEDDINTVNHTAIEDSIANSKKTLNKLSVSDTNDTFTNDTFGNASDGYNSTSNLTAEADAILDAY